MSRSGSARRIGEALERVRYAVAHLALAAPDLDMLEDLTQLTEWLELFHPESVVELDYGAVADKVYPDDSPMDVRLGIECLAEGRHDRGGRGLPPAGLPLDPDPAAGPRFLTARSSARLRCRRCAGGGCPSGRRPDFGRRRRAPDDQLVRRHRGAHRPGDPVELVQQHLGAEFGLFVRALADRGEPHGLGEVVVVDPDHGEVLGDPHTGPVWPRR